jgi:hypothetical protein
MFATLLFSMMLPTFAQTTVLTSPIDDQLTVKTVMVAPLNDNVSGIYAKPLTTQLSNIVDEDRQWDLKSFPGNRKATLEDFEDQPKLVQDLLTQSKVDALLAGRITKGPKGLSLRLELFSGKDGLPLAQENLQDYPGFEISDLRQQLDNSYKNLKAKMPYAGLVLSRKNQLVTVNMGTLQGIQSGDDLSVIQIIKVTRHPRFHFIIKTEKEIIGRIHVDKAEESLSFGSIIMERTENVVQPGMKVIAVKFVKYSDSPVVGGKMLPGLAERPDSQVAFGNEAPKEWVPARPPSFGKIGLLFGLGSYAVSNNLQGVGSVNGRNSLTPSLHLDGELWLTKNWYGDLQIREFVAQISNGYSGSSPGHINLSATEASLQFGYNFLIADDFYGPKFQLSAGLTQFNTHLDDSTPEAYTSMKWGGLGIGLGGSFPIASDVPVTLGAKLNYYLSTSLSESPDDSGSSSSPSITQFSVYGTYRYTPRMNLRADILYDLYSSSFSGTGSRTPAATSASHTITTLAGGVEFLF